MAINIINGNNKSRDIFYNNEVTIKDVKKLGDAILVEYKNNIKEIYQDFDILAKDTNFNNKSNFLDYIKTLEDSTKVLTEIVKSKDNLKADDIIILPDGKITRVSDIDLNNYSGSVNDPFTDNSVIAYYPFDKDVKDHSSNGYDGVWDGTAKYQEDAINVLHNDHSVYIENKNIIEDGKLYSVFLWVKFLENDTNNSATFTKYNYSNTSNKYRFIFGRVDNKLGIFNGENYGWNKGNETLENNIWYHIGFTMYQDKTKIFLNGKFSFEVDKQTHFYEDFHVYFGDSDYKKYGSEQLIKKAYIFNRALDNDEVQKLYNENFSLRKLIIK